MSNLREKVFGCYLGAAVGDALGGPVQASHAERIRKQYGGLKEMIYYRKPPGFFDVGPGYALRSDPGSVTDESLVRAQFADFVVRHSRSRNTAELVDHILRYGDLKVWPKGMVEPIERIRRKETRPELAGVTHPPGGGASWWVPIGLIHPGEPAKAAEEVVKLSAIWKRPLEQDLVGAVAAGVAHALTPRATVDSLVKAATAEVGPLAKSLIDRAVEIGRAIPRGELQMFIEQVYQALLVEEAPDGIDDELPPPAFPPPNPDIPTSSPLLAEQVPLAFAALVFGDGRSRATLLAAASLGRDSKTITSIAGAWIGALVGRARMPREWIGAVVTANLNDVDFVSQANQLADEAEPEINL